MLGINKMLLTQHSQAFKKSMALLSGKPAATFMTVLVIAVTLTLPLLLHVLIQQVKQSASNWDKIGRIALYLSIPSSTAEEAGVLAQVQSTPGVRKAILTSADDGLAILQQQEGMQDIMHYLTSNPLPAVIEVFPSDEANTPAAIEQLAQTLRTYAHVDRVQLDMQWIQKLYNLLILSNKISTSLMIFLAFAVILIIINTLRLTIHHQHEEIKILKLIGASEAFILRPFLYCGISYGLVGALLAIVFVNVFIFNLHHVLEQLTVFYQIHFNLSGITLESACVLILIAITFGWLAAQLTVRRQLKMLD